MNLVWHFVCLALCVECTLARPPREKVEIAEAFVSAEDDELYEKVKNAEWEVKTERELSMGLFDIFRRSSRQRRSYDLHDWMTAEQKDEIRNMERTKIAPEAIRDKILVFYEELSPETKNEWDKKYKDHCGEWVKSVASEDEIAELKELRANGDYDRVHEKLAEYKTRLSDPDRARVELWKDVCAKLWKVSKKQDKLRRLRRNLETYRRYLSWLSAEQYISIERMKEDGASVQDVHDKITEYFYDLPQQQQDSIEEDFRDKCIELLKDVVDDDQIEHLRTLYRNGEIKMLRTKIDSYFKKLTNDHSVTFHRLAAMCKDTWNENGVKTRRRRKIDTAYKEWIGWMSEDMKKEIEDLRNSGSSFDEIHAKINAQFDKLEPEKRRELLDFYKQKCKAYFSSISTEEEINEMKRLYEAGGQHKVTDIINEAIERLPDEKKIHAKKFQKICNDVYYKMKHRKARRDINTLMEKHLSWLTAEQKEEIRSMKQEGASNTEIKAKLMSMLQQKDDTDRPKAVQKTKESCYAWLKEVATVEEREELERLHHRDHSACKKKVREFIRRLPDAKQEIVNRDLDICEQIWYGGHQHQGGHDHSLHHHHQRRDADGPKTKESCYAWLKEVATVEEREELERLHHRDHSACKKKVREFIRRLPEAKQEIVNRDLDECEQIWYGGSHDHSSHHHHHHQRRDIDGTGKGSASNHHFTLENSMDTHLKWLSPEQKEELLEMKKSGKSKKEIQAKVEHYLNHLEGDAKKEATQSLIGGCREILKYVIGEENTAELRSMKDSGATNEELKSKLHTFVDAVHDEHKKGYVDDFGPACMKLYGITSSRRRRDHRFTLESSLDTHLKWLNADQKEHLLQMKKDGKDKKEIQGKLMHYYEELDGDAKKQATENLIGGCREILKYVIGEEKTAELKSMKESGVSKDELKAKLHVFLDEVHDEEKKKYIDDFGPACMKLYGIKHSRMRRHRHHFTLESCMDTHLKWLNPQQKEALLQMKKDGKNKKEIQEKLMHYYGELEGDAKKQASENLIGGCREVLKYVIGEEKTAELKSMKESGVSKDDLKAKLHVFLGEVHDEEKKKYIDDFGPVCMKLYGISEGANDHQHRNVRHTEIHEDHPSEIRHRRSNVWQRFLSALKFY